MSGRLSGVRKGKPVLSLGGKAPSGKPITRVELTIPKGWTLASQRGRSGSRYAKVSKLSVKGGATLKRLSSRRVRITMPKGGERCLQAPHAHRHAHDQVLVAAEDQVEGELQREGHRRRQVYTVPFKLTPR